MPWKIKRFCLVYFYGYDISKSAHIGLSYIFPQYLKMEEGSKIGNFNVAIHLSYMHIGRKSTINRGNWITGFPERTKSPHFAHDMKRRSELIMGKESAITKSHHIDCTNAIHIGDFTTIVGYRSQFLTYSIDIYKGIQDRHPIEIGNYCFVSTAVRVLGGAKLPDYSVLGAGAVLSKSYEESYCLYAGVPAKYVKSISQESLYFTRKQGFVN